MKKIHWCKTQSSGIRFVEPSSNLYKAYIQKAKSALIMLSAAIEKDQLEWIATTSYYARYFTSYAVLQKFGLKCEIHDCTITLLKFLTTQQFADQLDKAKDDRIALQYQIQNHPDEKNIIKRAKKAYDFVVQLTEYTQNNESNIRQKIHKITKPL